MKTIIVVLINIFVFQQGIAQTLLDGLVVHYPLDGNILDQSGNGHDGSFVFASKAIDRYGNEDGCFHFNGINEYIEISNDPELKLYPPFTVSLWVYIDEKFSRGKGLFTNDYKENMYSGYALGLTPLQYISVGLGNGGTPSNASANTFKTIKTYSSLGWYHIVTVVHSMYSADIYIDGTAEQTTAQSNNASMFYANAAGRIGMSDYTSTPGDEGWFQGKIDDLAMWSRSLTQDEVYELYQYGIVYPTGIEQPVSQNASLIISPNPTVSDYVHVNSPKHGKVKFDMIRIYNSLGSLVWEEHPQNQLVNIRKLSPGIYFINAFLGGRFLGRSKLVIIR